MRQAAALALTALCIVQAAAGAVHCIRDGAAGDGSSWSSAWDDLPAPYDLDLFGRLRGADGVWDRGAVEAAAPGDADSDGDVDLDDFVRLKQNFGAAAGATWSMGDFDSDGDVDLDDFVILKQRFGT
ncbi:MAG: hypothetical protein GX591_02100 [Planctomycetes bacterium]|nr:hypothetical protein [Planctomycetota bacterium]